MKKLAVLVSGRGSILEAILASGIAVELVLADRKCRALEIALEQGVVSELIERKSFGKDFDRPAYSEQILDAFVRHDIALVAMAGFMTVLKGPILERYAGRILNTHPSLLPLFKGDNAVEDALRAGVSVTGCTVHYALAELDAGPIIAQEQVPVLSGDTREILHERIKKVERKLYPRVIRELIEK